MNLAKSDLRLKRTRSKATSEISTKSGWIDSVAAGESGQRRTPFLTEHETLQLQKGNIATHSRLIQSHVARSAEIAPLHPRDANAQFLRITV